MPTARLDEGADRATPLSRRELLAYTGATGAAAALAAVTGGAFTPAYAAGDINGIIHDGGGEVFNVRHTTYGAKGDTKLATGGSISAGSTSFTASAPTFASTDVGKVITIQGAGPSGGVLSAVISAFTDATHVTLSAPAATSVSGAGFAFGTDDTASILAAVAAAGLNGTVFVPPGTYMLRGAANGNAPVSLASIGGLLGTGGGSDSKDADDASTTFLCGDATAGIVTIGSATYRGFRCDGNNIATTPLQNGAVVAGQATTKGSRSTYIDVWSVRSAANGWTIYGTQHSSYYSCGSIDSAQDGLAVDGGAGWLELHHWTESGSGRYGVRGAADVPGGAGTLGDRTEGIRFWGGTLASEPNAAPLQARATRLSRRAQTNAFGAAVPDGVSKVHLRSAYDWKFVDVTIRGDALSGPTVDLHQASGSALSFARCRISATTTGAQPGLACIQVAGAPPAGAGPITFVTTDSIRFVAGDTSVYLQQVGSYRYSALDWVFDETVNGPVAAAGLPGIETLLEGREGHWQTATLSAPWVGALAYRREEHGHVRLKGSVTSSTGTGGSIFTLPAGYRPGGGSGPALTLLAALSGGFAPVTVSAAGVVAAGAPGSNTLHLDGIRFPVD